VTLFSAAIKSGYVVLAVIGPKWSDFILYVTVAEGFSLRFLSSDGLMRFSRKLRNLKVAATIFAPLSLTPFMIVALIVSVWGTIHLGIFPARIIEFAQKATFLY
jgi:NADH-quinone oxidoreductase subunit N